MSTVSEQAIPARVSRSAGDAPSGDLPTPAGLLPPRPCGSARRQPDGSGAVPRPGERLCGFGLPAVSKPILVEFGEVVVVAGLARRIA